MDAYFCHLINDELYMQRCLQLAAMGAGKVAPNPMVGAVLVYNDRIIGEGYHQRFGEAHAEVNCISSVAEADEKFISSGTLYVSLEPCAHFGKTPPCADLIIKNKIPKVVIGCRDSFEAVAGKGIERLKKAGVEVTVGILEKECLELNKRFFTFYEKQRPYIILKWAQSSDGKIGAVGTERVLISNEITNRLVHQWRSEEAAILVGTNTALQDDPALTTRLWPGNNPVRLVIDMDLKLPASLKLFDVTVKTIVFNEHRQDDIEMLSYYKIESGATMLTHILQALHNLQIQSVMVEGGAALLQSFINEHLWDEARVITNTAMEIAEGINAPILQHQKLVKAENIQADSIVYFKNNSQ
jgi:diaminohydroxyphosphoribosylaminopyrimidine deaminase / 5-amino-6-(5-phosphoribosylamino)uracil reductase